VRHQLSRLGAEWRTRQYGERLSSRDSGDGDMTVLPRFRDASAVAGALPHRSAPAIRLTFAFHGFAGRSRSLVR
jgi:hypothetical protein